MKSSSAELSREQRDGTKPPRKGAAERRPAPEAVAPSPRLTQYVKFTGGLWLLVLLLWARQELRAGGSVVFLLAASVAAVFVGATVVRLARRQEPLATVSRAVLLVLLAAIPVLFDPRTQDVFNVTRFTLVVVSAFALGGLLLAGRVRGEEGGPWRNGLHWPVLALVAWTAMATAASLNPRLSLLGDYQSYDGLYSTMAFALVFFAIARVFTIDHMKMAVSVLFFAGGGLCVLYGLMQLHDRQWGGSWDWVNWGKAGSFSATSAIWSTFGNPNHLAGFLAILIPIGLVLLLLYRSWWVRGLVVAINAGLLLEMLHTTTRGAWLGAIVALVIVGLLLLPDILRRPAVAFSLGGMVAVVVLASALALNSGGELARQLGSAFEVGGKSTASQRFELWGAGVRMAGDRPLVGVGPDVYASVFQPYKSAKLARLFGQNIGVNGPHNVFVSHLAGLGYPGLVLFVSLLAFAGLRAVGAWRRLRAIEKGTEGVDQGRAREARLVLTAVVGGLFAYLVQASFNVQQLGLTFAFWALLGLLCVLASGAGVPATLRPRMLFSRPSPDDLSLAPAEQIGPSKASAAHRTPTTRSSVATPGQGAEPAVPVLVMLGAVILMVFTAFASRPYRAERSFYRGSLSQSVSARLRQTDPERAARLAVEAHEKLEKAIRLNPWEPTYLAFLANGRFGFATRLPAGSPQQLGALRHARQLYERALPLDPRDADLLRRYAGVLMSIHSLDRREAATGNAKAEAIALMRRAVRANPFDTSIAEELRMLSAARPPAAPLPPTPSPTKP
ncbi:MAG TPA: O-antigen ligase family protein [Acidimicrobiales bacterium]|nr:O-antigen ligase family protein [Acidimicrobiales bacterium]